jgi:AbrB family looped-hinge helix DNA binding protein
MPADQLTTKISIKGQVILPKVIRERWQWDAGTRLVIEETAEGVLLRPVSIFARTKPKEVFGSLPFSGRARTSEEMNAGVLAEARRRHDRG